VKPTSSAKSTVTTLRASRGAIAISTIGVAQLEQKVRAWLDLVFARSTAIHAVERGPVVSDVPAAR
jgi:hypothetical protein